MQTGNIFSFNLVSTGVSTGISLLEASRCSCRYSEHFRTPGVDGGRLQAALQRSACYREIHRISLRLAKRFKQAEGSERKSGENLARSRRRWTKSRCLCGDHRQWYATIFFSRKERQLKIIGKIIKVNSGKEDGVSTKIKCFSVRAFIGDRLKLAERWRDARKATTLN